MSQNWLITGAGRGFGRAFVSAAAESGAEVYAGVRHVPEGDPLFSSPRVHPLIFDVTKPGEVNAAVERRSAKQDTSTYLLITRASA